MNYERLYRYRFQGIDQQQRTAVWNEIAPHVYSVMGNPSTVLDPAAGRGEFINAIPASERWAVDEVEYDEADRSTDVKFVTSRIMDSELPAGHFDGVFVSNFLEHLPSQEGIAEFLERMHTVMKPGGRIAILGPNIRYVGNAYWDCADHHVPLTHLAVCEHLYAAGFEIERTIPRYLPYSFRGITPSSPTLVKMYLKAPLAWRILGKQFLVVGRT